MPNPIVQQLEALKPDSGKQLPTSVLYGFGTSPGGRMHLVTPKPVTATDWEAYPIGGKQAVLTHSKAYNKVFTLDRGKLGFMQTLNEALKGGDSYPVLTAALGTVAGFVTAGAGLLFAASSLALDLSRRDTDVLARLGDEVWHAEQIGKVKEKHLFSSDEYVPMYVNSFLLVDPYRLRGHCEVTGWLLHEDRWRVNLG